MILVPAGKPVDNVIGDVLLLLSENDILIDTGNSFFEDTERCGKKLAGKNILSRLMNLGRSTWSKIWSKHYTGRSERSL